MIDLLAWNAMPHVCPTDACEYLERLFLNNEFAEGHFTVEGKPVAAKNIQVPIFAVSTEKDHVAPWRSVYKIHLMTNTPITFVLTEGGHNAGIISEPNKKGRSYKIHERKKDESYLSSTNWLDIAEKRKGSWWLAE